MEFLTPVALGALILVPVLILLHLRRRRSVVEEVPSLLLWREVFGENRHGGRSIGLPELPLLLLQFVAVTTLVLSLARPASVGQPFSQLVVVLDDSLRMSATDLHPTRLVVAKELIERQIAQTPSGSLVTIVAATAHPYLLVSTTNLAQVRQALDMLQPTAMAADLSAALRLAAGLRGTDPRNQPSIVLVHARDDVVPPVTPAGMLTTRSVGISTANQVLLHLSVRCTAVGKTPCTAFAAIRNEDSRPVTVPLVIQGDGAVLAEQSIHLSAHADVGLSFVLPSGIQLLTAYLAHNDILPLDNVAWCVVPLPSHAQVTLIGDQAHLAPLQRAFAALGSVSVRTATPDHYAAALGAGSTLWVFAGWLPPLGLPAAPAVLLVDPPSLPGGRVQGTLENATISGMDAASPLLDGVDFTALDIPANAAPRLILPSGVLPVVWSADGPLLAAGRSGMQEIGILAMDPLRSNLAQLNAFPLLLRNILRWSIAWLPPSATVSDGVWIYPPPGTTQVTIARMELSGRVVPLAHVGSMADQPLGILTDQPGVYTVLERGNWGSRQGHMAVNNAPPVAASQAPAAIALDARSSDPGLETPGSAGDRPWWPWIGLIAFFVIGGEWLYVLRRPER